MNVRDLFNHSYFELSCGGLSAPHYTYSGKGWGGADLSHKDSSGRIAPVGLDCSGLVTGFFSRWGMISHDVRNFWNAEKLRSECEEVNLERLRPLDLVFYGGDRATHIAIVAEPKKVLFESAGGYSSTLPDGEYESKLRDWGLSVSSNDWPPSGRVRFTRFQYRTSDLIGFGRLRVGGVSPGDKRLLDEWTDHVRSYLGGEVEPLSNALKSAGYRAIDNQYYDNARNWKV
jgi:hypothetical protein